MNLKENKALFVIFNDNLVFHRWPKNSNLKSVDEIV